MLILLGAAAGCDRYGDGGQPDNRFDHSGATPAQIASAACASSSTKLPLTRLCPQAAASLMLVAPGPAIAAPEGCGWTTGEVMFSANEGLLYRAARCGSRTAKLGYTAGEPFARFTLTASPYAGPLDSADVIARMTAARNQADLLKIARRSIGDHAERERCQVRLAGIEGWPADALVVDEVPAPATDGVRSACGELGLDEDAQTFWRLSQGHGWFFQLGQESPVLDAGSFTLIHKTGTGDWKRQ